jgi:hypothetical protein
VLAEALLSGQAEEVVRRVIGAALEGDAMAQRLCMERIIVPRRLERVHFAMPVLATGADAAKALAAIAVTDCSASEDCPQPGISATRARSGHWACRSR